MRVRYVEGPEDDFLVAGLLSSSSSALIATYVRTYVRIYAEETERGDSERIYIRKYVGTYVGRNVYVKATSNVTQPVAIFTSTRMQDTRMRGYRRPQHTKRGTPVEHVRAYTYVTSQQTLPV